ncbi:hypothetical protein [Paenibacillus validus]|uniref:hypothetical protein n=1 Tax=Paenibacillus validus TaxID=44253 RepID=UPI003D2CED33
MRKGSWLVIALVLMLLAGCGGGGTKADVPIFIMSSTSMPGGAAEKLEAALVSKVGEAPTVAVAVSPMFSLEKMIIEVAAAGNGILVLPGDQFRGLGKQGGYVPLDELAKAEDFPDGVLELPVDGNPDGKLEKHLFGIPVEKTTWFADLGLSGQDLYAFIPQNAPDIEKAKQVMKHIAQK